MNMTLVVLLAVLILPAPDTVTQAEPLSQARGVELNRRDCDKVEYALLDDATAAKIRVSRVSRNAGDDPQLQSLKTDKSPQGTAAVANQRPDYSRLGPWNTTVHVFSNSARNVALRIELVDHGQYDVQVAWLNEKLLGVRVFWGRIRGSDLILDIEQGMFLYSENADYGSLVRPCGQR